MFTVAALFSLNYIVSKVAMHSFAALSFAWLRVAGAAILLNVFAPGRGFTRSDSLRITGFAILGVVLNQTMFLGGLSLTNAHVAAILITTIPVFTLIVAIILRLERTTVTKVSGIALALAGALLVVGGEGSSGMTGAVAGTLLIIGNCMAYAVYLVVSKPVVSRLSSTRVVSRMFAIGAVLILPIALPSLLRQEWRSIPGSAWLGLLVVIAGPTVGAYVINAWTLKYAEASVVAAYTYLQPVLTTIMAWAFLHERIRPIVAVAGLMIFGGVGLASSKRGPRTEAGGGVE
jgi:drug/metabolite transporter (DMT)-like permease